MEIATWEPVIEQWSFQAKVRIICDEINNLD
jgi:hypothetical protein